MRQPLRPFALVDPNPDGRLRVEAAALQAGLAQRVDLLEDLGALRRYLNRQGEFEVFQGQPLPGVVLLDLGPDTLMGLRTLKRDPNARGIPVVLFSQAQDDAQERPLWAEGANSVIPRPGTFDGLVEVMRALDRYWTQTVRLP